MKDTDELPNLGIVATRFLFYAGVCAITVMVIGAIPIFVWHSFHTYRFVADAVQQEHKQHLDVLAHFCEAEDSAYRRGMVICVDALRSSRRNLQYEIMERFIAENISHLPLVHYCSNHDTCRDMILLATDTIRQSLFWLIMLGLPMMVFVLYLWISHLTPKVNSSLRAVTRWADTTTREGLPIKND